MGYKRIQALKGFIYRGVYSIGTEEVYLQRRTEHKGFIYKGVQMDLKSFMCKGVCRRRRGTCTKAYAETEGVHIQRRTQIGTEGVHVQSRQKGFVYRGAHSIEASFCIFQHYLLKRNNEQFFS